MTVTSSRPALLTYPRPPSCTGQTALGYPSSSTGEWPPIFLDRRITGRGRCSATHHPCRRTFGSLIFAKNMAGLQTGCARSGEGDMNLVVLFPHRSDSGRLRPCRLTGSSFASVGDDQIGDNQRGGDRPEPPRRAWPAAAPGGDTLPRSEGGRSERGTHRSKRQRAPARTWWPGSVKVAAKTA